MKHYTSKLSTYSDLSTLETFGFRGEALSSLCALSRFTVTTCLQSDVPKGSKLEFETSGKLKGTGVVATQKGTTVSVENLFQNLPVRRRELERNIKREWGKVISLLNQYACIQTGVKFTVSQQPNKGKRIVLFSTKGNKTTRENIINVFGAKTMSALLALDLKLELELTSGPGQRRTAQDDGITNEVLVKGYVSKPVHGEGRQTPDRQMFYVNSRPCGLPQFAKVFNEVYRSFNSSQSPFIFADIQLDTHLYDVNVSPDKRTILLHDQSRMLENLRSALTELFEKQDFTLPVSQITSIKQSPFKKLTPTRQESSQEKSDNRATPGKAASLTLQESEDASEASEDEPHTAGISRIKNLAAAKALARGAQASNPTTSWGERDLASREDTGPAERKAASRAPEEIQRQETGLMKTHDGSRDSDAAEDASERAEVADTPMPPIEAGQDEDDFITRLARMKRSFLPESLREQMSDSEIHDEPPIPAISKPTNPPDTAPLSSSLTRPPKRSSQEVATITVGEHTVTSIIGTPSKRLRRDDTASLDQRRSHTQSKTPNSAPSLPSFGGRLTQMFAAMTAEPESTIGDEALQSEAADSDGESIFAEENYSESSPQDTQEDDGASDKSSPLFVEQEEDVQSSFSPHEEDRPSSAQSQEAGEGVLDEKDSKYSDENNIVPQASEVDELVTAAEAAQEESEENQKRTQVFLKGGTKGRYSTQKLLQRLKLDEESLQRRLETWEAHLREYTAAGESNAAGDVEDGIEAENAEEKLALTIHKGDFGKMKIVGQFNLGFVLAVRPRTTSESSSSPPAPAHHANQEGDDELFIIDQHASDEKFNFERLQASTVVQSQRLVRPKPLELTAVEEEIILENQAALEKNGFIVSVDESGDEPVGSRCELLSLPLSRETTFSPADLEELISLLGDNPTTTSSSSLRRDEGDALGAQYVPRPSKVRKMFAMRACRSSIMIGKALSHQQMERVVRHMGEMEKPWNCPHGRPTMRHLCGLGAAWDERGWREGGDSADDADDLDSLSFGGGGTTDWAGYVKQMRSEAK